LNAEKLPVKCDDCGTLKWANAVTNEAVCPVCELGFSSKKVEGYENSSQGVLVEKSMCEAQEYEREECAKICDKLAEEKFDAFRTVTDPHEFVAAEAQSFVARQLAKQIRARKS